MSEQLRAFWLSASPDGFFARCVAEELRMRESREAKLLGSGKIMEPRLWRNEEDYAKKPATVRTEAA